MRIISVVALAAALGACTQQRPNIRAGSQTLEGVPRLVKAESCDAGSFGTQIPIQPGATYAGGAANRQLGGIGAILASALITQGVDFLGERLKAGGEEKTRTLDASMNFAADENVGCFDFIRGGMRFRIAMIPINGSVSGEAKDNSHVYFTVVGLDYPESINLERSGTRGLSLTFEITRPGSEDTVSQTISLRNVEVGARVPSIPVAGNPLTSGYISNPFLTFAKLDNDTQQIASLNLPFTLRVQLTEVRNANELSRFASGVVESANDDLTAALIRAAGVRDDDDEDDGDAEESEADAGNTEAPPAQSQPPGTRNRDSRDPR